MLGNFLIKYLIPKHFLGSYKKRYRGEKAIGKINTIKIKVEKMRLSQNLKAVVDYKIKEKEILAASNSSVSTLFIQISPISFCCTDTIPQTELKLKTNMRLKLGHFTSPRSVRNESIETKSKTEIQDKGSIKVLAP